MGGKAERNERMMTMKKILPCPFCGGSVRPGFPDIIDHKDGTWGLTHFCRTYEREPGDLEVCIVAYGKTEDEAIERWNRRVTQNV